MVLNYRFKKKREKSNQEPTRQFTSPSFLLGVIKWCLALVPPLGLGCGLRSLWFSREGFLEIDVRSFLHKKETHANTASHGVEVTAFNCQVGVSSAKCQKSGRLRNWPVMVQGGQEKFAWAYKKIGPFCKGSSHIHQLGRFYPSISQESM